MSPKQEPLPLPLPPVIGRDHLFTRIEIQTLVPEAIRSAALVDKFVISQKCPQRVKIVISRRRSDGNTHLAFKLIHLIVMRSGENHNHNWES